MYENKRKGHDGVDTDPPSLGVVQVKTRLRRFNILHLTTDDPECCRLGLNSRISLEQVLRIPLSGQV